MPLAGSDDDEFVTGLIDDSILDDDGEDIYDAYERQQYFDGLEGHDDEVDPIDSSRFDLCPPGTPGCTDEGRPASDDSSPTDANSSSDDDFNRFDGDFSDSGYWNTTSSYDQFGDKLTLP